MIEIRLRYVFSGREHTDRLTLRSLTSATPQNMPLKSLFGVYATRSELCRSSGGLYHVRNLPYVTLPDEQRWATGRSGYGGSTAYFFDQIDDRRPWLSLLQFDPMDLSQTKSYRYGDGIFQPDAERYSFRVAWDVNAGD